jgi:hypothetical protein
MDSEILNKRKNCSTLRAEVALKTLLFAQRSYSYSTEYHLQS